MTEVFHQLLSFSWLSSTSMQSGLNSFFPRDCKHLILVNLSLPNTLLYREQVCPREGGSLSLCLCCHNELSPTRIVTFFHSLVVSFMEHYHSLSSAFAIQGWLGGSLSVHPTEDFNLTLGFSAGCSSPNWSCVVLVAQWCPNLCNPVDCSPPGSSVHGTLQARRLEWVSISSCRGSSQPRNRTLVLGIAGRFFTIWSKVCLE